MALDEIERKGGGDLWPDRPARDLSHVADYIMVIIAIVFVAGILVGHFLI